MRWFAFLFTSLAALVAPRAQANEFFFEFGTPGVSPTTQGVSYTDPPNEAAAFTVNAGVLTQDTRSVTTAFAQYNSIMFGLGANQDVQMEWKLQVFSNTGDAVQIFFNDIVTARSWRFNIATDGIDQVLDGVVTPPQRLVRIVSMNTGDTFHTYRVSIPKQGLGFELFVDGILRHRGMGVQNDDFVTFGWGDASPSSGAFARWEYVRFATPPPLETCAIAPRSLDFSPSAERASARLALQQLESGDAVVWMPTGRALQFKTGQAGSAGNRTTFLANGRVGLGTTAPRGRLDVRGDVFVTGTIFGSNGLPLAQGPQGPAGPAGPQGLMGLTGLTGATGARGLQGVQGIQGPAGPAATLSCSTVVQTYQGIVQAFCPMGTMAVTASCNAGVNVVLTGQTPASPLGEREFYLLPNADAATGVRCRQLSGITSELQLRCCRTSP